MKIRLFQHVIICDPFSFEYKPYLYITLFVSLAEYYHFLLT